MTQSFPPPNYIQTQSAVDGITIYMPAPETEEHHPVVEFNCPQCKATTAYSVGDGGLTCTHCGYYEAPQKKLVGKGAEDFEFTVETVSRASRGWGVSRLELQCQSCGVYTSIAEQTLTHQCPFCNANNVIQHQDPQAVLRPRFVIPFKVNTDTCQTIVHKWLGSSWMVPGTLRNLASLGKFTTIYLPYWTFDARNKAAWKAEVGHRKTVYERGEKRVKTVWKWESGSVNTYVDDMLISGTSHVSTLLLSQIEGFNLTGLAPYEPGYLAGHQAQAYDISLEKAWERARHGMRENTRRACRGQASNDRIRNFSMNLDFSEESWRYILVPVYLATYRYGKNTYQIVLNGQTGVIAGQRPVSWLRVSAVAGALLTPGILAVLTGVLLYTWQNQENCWIILGFVFFIIGAVFATKTIQQALKMDDA